jgi:tetratricopeptide (TPR) repeat protein
MKTKYGFIVLWVVTLSTIGTLVADEELKRLLEETSRDAGGNATKGQAVERKAAPVEAASGNESLNYLFDRRNQRNSPLNNDATRKLADRFTALEIARNFRFENEAMRTRFDKFLNTEEVSQEDVAAFLKMYEDILELLRSGRFNHAWVGMMHMGNNVVDGGASREIANRVESVWQNRKHIRGINQRIQQLRQDIDNAHWNADMMARTHRNEMAQSRIQPRSVPNQPQASAPVQGIQGTGRDAIQFAEGKLRMSGEYLKSVEARGRIQLEEAKLDAISAKARSDFADHISTLFANRRHHQVVLAANFYRYLFDEGDYPVVIANQVNHSLQVIRDTNTTIEAFRFKMENDQLAGAAETLQAAFVTAETHPAVVSLKRDMKQKVAFYWRDTVRVQNLIEARDYGNLEKLLQAMEEKVSDFDPTKAYAAITFAKLESQMHIGKARLYAQNGNVEMAMQELQSAAEAWPANPDIKTAAETFFQSQDVANQTVVEFDQMMGRGDYRGIAEKQILYLAAVRDDAGRFEKFGEALTKVKNSEMAAEKARMLSQAGDFVGAWESIHMALADWPDDVVLNRLRSDYAMRCAEFVSLLNNARDAEKAGNNGYALSLYVRAQTMYPGSRIAHDAIQRLSAMVLAQS